MSCTPTLPGQAAELDIVIEQGATFDRTMTWRQKPTVKRAISAITKANPGKVTAAAHGFVTGDVVFLSRLKGMEQANNLAFTITVLDANNFTIGVNTSAYDAYVSSGIADNGKPTILTGYTARMQVRATIAASSALLDLTTANGGVTLGGTAGTIRILATATQTAALTINEGFYDLELIDGAGAVRRLLKGSVTVSKEVTR
jgi:ubiquitin-activating enzyme E1-like protein